MSQMIRIGDGPHQALRELAARMGQSMQAVLAQAIEEFRRKKLFEEADAAYAALQADPKAWEAELAERRAWEATLSDGLPESRKQTSGRKRKKR
jgi:predicted transcriptional regulator